MSDFQTTVRGLAGTAIAPAVVDGIVEMVIADVAGCHRWPFLLKVQESKTWAASDAIQAWPGVLRIVNVMVPDSGGDYYALEELSDYEFQKWIELNPNDTEMRVWRDAGRDGSGNMQIEVYAAPTSAKTFKVDYIELPQQSQIDTLPARFQLLVLIGVQAHLGLNGVRRIDYDFEKQRVIAREQDLQGKRGKMGMDAMQAMRWRNVNNPT